ncbi:MAG: LamG domain-containing protein [Planctomycetota bacterium]|nr:MAG: LamG domain-containing protein [Planctomycetota bacterium]
MGKKLYLLVCFLLVVGVNSTSRSASIDVNNHSFEYDINGVQITELTGWDSVKGWVMRDTTEWGAGWQFVDDEFVWVDGYEAADGNVCSFNVTADEPNDPNASCQIYQILDDPNAVISENRRYTLTFNALRMGTEDIPTVYAALFYSVGGVNVAPANDVILAEEEVFLTSPPWGEADYAGWEEIEMTYTALSGASSIGETLGVKLSVPTHDPWFSGYQVVLDNVRVDWLWATDAWGPYPSDGAREVPRDVTLGWKPGVWVQDTDGHEVYFGTDETAVQDATTSSVEYQGAEDGNSWSVLNYSAGGLELGRTYYWRVDEVNEAYSGTNPPAPPDGRWKGPAWSFRTTGYAINPSPYDGEVDVPFLGLELSWTAGTEAEEHVVYFGTDEEAVANATTSSPEWETELSLGTESYPITGGLTVGQTYYWRIDEKSAGGSHIITGDVWRFTVGMFLVVENFESYLNNSELWSVWDDYWGNGSGGEIFIEKDVNIVRDIDNPQAVLCWYTNSDKTEGSYFDVQDMTELEIGSDWTIGGVKALQLWMRGDPCSELKNDAEGWPWVELEDTSSNSGYVLYPAAYIGHVLEDSWHEWNIDLEIFDACGVELTAIDRFTIGIGGAKAGQKQANSNTNNMWFDDIRLYPPRCRTDVEGVAYFNSKGDLTGPDGMIDCTVDYYDLDVMTDEWLLSGQWVSPAAPASAPEVWYRFDDGPSSTVVNNDGLWGSAYDIAISSPPAADEPVWTTDTAPALDRLDPNYALDFDGTDDYLEIPNSPATNFSGTENMTITTWIKGTTAAWSAFVCSAKGSGDRHATGIGTMGANEFGYFWNEWEWQWDSGLAIPDNQWTFAAVAVEPTQATAYLYDGSNLDMAANVVAHGPLEEFGTDDWTVLGQDAKTDPEADTAYFDGMLDDVRLYNKTLTIAEIAGLCGMEELLYVPLDSVADLVVGIKDPNDPNQPVDDQIDFMDYEIMATNWLEQYLWP